MIDVDKIIQESPKFWGYQRKSILQATADFIKPNRKITDVELEYIIKHQLKRTRNHRQTLKQVALVLTKLKDEYGIDTVIPPVPITVPRPSILPTTSTEFSWIDGCQALEDTFWNHWVPAHFKQDKAPLFTMAFTLASYVGIQAPLIANAICQLTWNDILEDGKALKLKVHPQDRDNRYCIIHLPTPASLILKSILQNNDKASLNSHVFLSGSEPKFKKRKQRIQKILSSLYLSLLKVHQNKIHNVTPCPPNWKSFARIAYMKTYSLGVEPFIINALHSYPLPVSHPKEAKLNLYGKPYPHHLSLSQTTLPQNINLKLKTKIASTHAKYTLEEGNFKSDWCGASKTILRQLVSRLKRITSKKIHTDAQVTSASTEVNTAIEQAFEIDQHQTSALYLALMWIKDYIQTRRSVSPQTVDEYFSRVFYNGLLTFPDSDDITFWDSDDHEQAFEKVVSRTKLGSSRRKSIVSIYKTVYKFAQANGYIEQVNIKFASGDWVGSSTRYELIGLYQFDAFVQGQLSYDNRDTQTIAAMAALAFYGGLRASEASSLTLSDILIYEDEIYIEIPSGKSPAARRRIPFHLLAPKHTCDIIKACYQLRLQEFEEKASSSRSIILRNISIFGPKKSRLQYQRRSVIDETIKLMKQFLGDKFVYHSLRHSFASWLLLRWYANRYSDLTSDLAEGHHPLFKKECQSRLRQLFTTDTNKVPLHNSSDLIIFSKLIGHTGQDVMFSTYIHSYSAIHKHAMERISNSEGQRILSGKCIAAVVPKMKSRTSQANLKNKSITEIVRNI